MTKRHTPPPAPTDAPHRIVELLRQHSTAVLLLHHAVADRVGLGPTDMQCLDLLRERGPVTGSELASLTGLTTGAITGVVARLERTGYVRRRADPRDKRKQTLHPATERMHDMHALFGPLRHEIGSVLSRLDARQLETIAAFLTASTNAVYQQLAHLRTAGLQPGAHTQPGRHR